jgi:hypothetical protein
MARLFPDVHAGDLITADQFNRIVTALDALDNRMTRLEARGTGGGPVQPPDTSQDIVLMLAGVRGGRIEGNDVVAEQAPFGGVNLHIDYRVRVKAAGNYKIEVDPIAPVRVNFAQLDFLAALIEGSPTITAAANETVPFSIAVQGTMPLFQFFSFLGGFGVTFLMNLRVKSVTNSSIIDSLVQPIRIRA